MRPLMFEKMVQSMQTLAFDVALERQRAKIEDERKIWESQMKSMRKQMDALVRITIFYEVTTIGT